MYRHLYKYITQLLPRRVLPRYRGGRPSDLETTVPRPPLLPLLASIYVTVYTIVIYLYTLYHTHYYVRLRREQRNTLSGKGGGRDKKSITIGGGLSPWIRDARAPNELRRRVNRCITNIYAQAQNMYVAIIDCENERPAHARTTKPSTLPPPSHRFVRHQPLNSILLLSSPPPRRQTHTRGGVRGAPS
jgi:hypothetical protein